MSYHFTTFIFFISILSIISKYEQSIHFPVVKILNSPEKLGFVVHAPKNAVFSRNQMYAVHRMSSL